MASVGIQASGGQFVAAQPRTKAGPVPEVDGLEETSLDRFAAQGPNLLSKQAMVDPQRVCLDGPPGGFQVGDPEGGRQSFRVQAKDRAGTSSYVTRNRAEGTTTIISRGPDGQCQKMVYGPDGEPVSFEAIDADQFASLTGGWNGLSGG